MKRLCIIVVLLFVCGCTSVGDHISDTIEDEYDDNYVEYESPCGTGADEYGRFREEVYNTSIGVDEFICDEQIKEVNYTLVTYHFFIDDGNDQCIGSSREEKEYTEDISSCTLIEKETD